MVGEICQCVPNYLGNRPNISFVKKNSSRRPQIIPVWRVISMTPFLSKVYERILGQWLMPYVDPHLDPGQCGGLTGTSTTHYLIKMLHFIHSNLDKQHHAVILTLIDLQKAFNRVCHSLVIQGLFDMKVPGWILRILVSYLTVSGSKDPHPPAG